MYRQHLLPCARCGALRCPCRPEPSALEVELLHARGNASAVPAPPRRSKPHRTARRAALDANQPGMPPEIAGEPRTPGDRPRTGLTALEALENVSARKWSYRPGSAA